MKYSRSSDDTAFSIDMLDELLEEDIPEDSSKFAALEEVFDPEKDLLEIERLLEEAEYEELKNQAESPTRRVDPIYSPSTSEEKPAVANAATNSPSTIPALGESATMHNKLELKTLPDHLEYAFLEEGNQKPVIIASDLSKTEKEELVRYPVQPGSTECGYYMLRFMKEIVEEGIEELVKDNIGDGKVEYTTADIDEIREEWSTFVTGFIYR
ncbi:unnamed protein product [Lactuca saligna]|uniref:Ubiquitin-like protease family profile domain-containing protein n=1 Tax=Lactuca saligna TaxID=75948 RepID=A0AA35ZNU9_LACSI|nr:unnamed protein product [Lactuca saligna]